MSSGCFLAGFTYVAIAGIGASEDLPIIATCNLATNISLGACS